MSWVSSESYLQMLAGLGEISRSSEKERVRESGGQFFTLHVLSTQGNKGIKETPVFGCNKTRIFYCIS